MSAPLGLLSWLAAGTVAGLLARVVLPGRPRMHLAAALVVGLWGGVLGGALATWLGFGGVVGYDVRGTVTAVLTAIFLLLLARALSLRYDASSSKT